MSQSKIPNFPTCHCHPSSLDSASTPAAFAKRELELETGSLTMTDHGTMQAGLQVYGLAKKNKLTPILGLEGYFRSDDCPILKAHGLEPEQVFDKNGNLVESTFRNYRKYYHITLHALDQDAYQAMGKVLSRAHLTRTERHGSEVKPLFTWPDLEEILHHNVTVGSGCLVGFVSGHLLNDRPDLARAYYEKLRGMTRPGNFYAEIFPHNCSTNYVKAGYIHVPGQEKMRLPTWKKVRIEVDGKLTEHRVEEWARKDWSKVKTATLVAVMQDRKWKELEQGPTPVSGAEVVEGEIANECRPWAKDTTDPDVQRAANEFVLELANKYNDTVIISDDSHFAYPYQKIIQDIRLATAGDWKMTSTYNRMSGDEVWGVFKRYFDEDQVRGWIDNNRAWAERFKDFKLKYEPSLPTKFYPEDSFSHALALIDKHGRMDWNNQVWVDRLQSEIKMLHENGKIDLLPYFFPVEEVVSEYEKRRELTGPGRGSAGGLIFAYLTGITQVEPLRYELSLERFLTADRVKSGKLPDIDNDLASTDWLFGPNGNDGWLNQRFGDHVVRISTATSLKVKSAIKDVCRVQIGHVPDEVEEWTKRLPTPPQGISDHAFVFGYEGSDGEDVPGLVDTDENLKRFIAKYPKQWEAVGDLLGLIRSRSKHACGMVVANKPISDFIPLQSLENDTVTQYTAADVETAGGIKIDFLKVNALNDLSVALMLIQERNGGTIEGDVYLPRRGRVPGYRIVPWRGQQYDIWDLPDDIPVYNMICEGKTDTVFQLGTPGAKQWLAHFDRVKTVLEDGTEVKALSCVNDLSAFTALDRPGPLDFMIETDTGSKHNVLVEFARRAAGEKPQGLVLPILDELCKDTYGLIVFQESLQKVYQTLGKTTGVQADEFRVHISKKQMEKVMKDKEVFMKGAVETLGEETALSVWNGMEKYGRYCFNRSIDQDTILESKNGNKSIKNFVQGDLIECVDDTGTVTVTEVVALHDHGELEGFEVEFDDGYRIVCSQNHKFLTPNGQVPLWRIVQEGLGVYAGRKNVSQRRKPSFPTKLWPGSLRLRPESRRYVSSGSVETSRCNSNSTRDEVLLWKRTQEDERRVGSMAYSDAPLSETGSLVLRRIVRVRAVGKRRMYDLEVSHPKHNFLLPNGVVTSNSHSVCYMVVGYATAFLKYHYPLEWWTAVLMNAEKDEIQTKFWPHCGHLIDLPDIVHSQPNFAIVNERIRAPISLLLGIGEKAHEQLLGGAPYSGLEDFCQKILDYKEKHRVQTQKQVEVPVLDGDGNPTGEVRIEIKTGSRAGTSALNVGVVSNLIVCGCLDSFFPESASTQEKIYEFNSLMARLQNKKVQPVPERFQNLNAWQHQQMQRQILPAYSAPLFPILDRIGHPRLRPGSGKRRHWLGGGKNKDEPVLFLTLSELEQMDRLRPWPEKMNFDAAVVAYIKSVRKFRYHNNTKNAIEFVLAIDGGDLQTVKWGGSKGLPQAWAKTEFAGAIAVVTLSKFAGDRPFAVSDITILQNPLDYEDKDGKNKND